MGEAKRRATVPPLREWLADNGARPQRSGLAGFDDYVEWVGRMLAEQKPADRRQRSMLLMLQTFGIAIVEVGNILDEEGDHHAEVLLDMGKSLGLALGYTVMSLEWRDDAPVRSLVTVLTEEVRRGLKDAFDNAHRDPTGTPDA